LDEEKWCHLSLKEEKKGKSTRDNAVSRFYLNRGRRVQGADLRKQEERVTITHHPNVRRGEGRSYEVEEHLFTSTLRKKRDAALEK